MSALVIKPTLAVALTAASMVACGLFSAMPAPAPQAAASPAATGGGQATLFSDDFSTTDNGWEVGPEQGLTIDYAGGGLRIVTWDAETFAWSPLYSHTFRDIHLEATIQDNQADKDHSFGLVCGQQVSNGKATAAHYFLAIHPSGLYKIGRRVPGQDDVILTGGGDWAPTKLFTKYATSYRLGADCGHGILTLYVDGQRIDSATDSTYKDGTIGLFVWSGNASVGPVVFDDVAVTALP